MMKVQTREPREEASTRNGSTVDASLRVVLVGQDASFHH